MGNIVWLDEYSVGIEEFDFHHRRIFSLIDELSDFSESEKVTKKEILELLNELFNYGSYHLEREEELFKQYKYPRKDKHEKFHNAYRDMVGKFIGDCKNGDCELKQLVDFLEDWWAKHILKEDMLYTDFFHENGVY